MPVQAGRATLWHGRPSATAHLHILKSFVLVKGNDLTVKEQDDIACEKRLDGVG